MDACRLAISLCGCTFSAVELVTAGETHVLAAVGAPTGRISRTKSAATRVIGEPGPVVVIPDVRSDARFADLQGMGEDSENGLRLFAAVLLRSGDGQPIGALTVGGLHPGDLRVDQVESLAALGRMVTAQLESGCRARQLEELEAEHARVDEALRDAERKYRGIFENTVVGIYQTTPEGRYLAANPMLARIYGYDSPGELMGAVGNIEAELYVHPEDRVRFTTALQQRDTISDFEARIRRKDGSEIWIVENARVVRDLAGLVKYYEGTVQDITARRHAEDQVRNSEVLYHSLVEELPQNIFRKDLRERFIFANTRFCETVGRSWAELEGRTDFDLFPANLARQYQEDDQKVIAMGRTFRTTEVNVTPDGETHWVEVIKSPLRDLAGNVIGTQAIFWDVTEPKRLQDQLAYERDLLQAFLDHIPDSIYFKDLQSRFVKVGRALARRFNISDPEKLVGRTVLDIRDPAQAAAAHTEEQELIRTGRPIVNKVEEIIDNHGGHSWASVTKVPIYNRDGKILGLVGVARDITQLIEAERALRDAEEKYRAIFENSVEGIFQTSLDGRFLRLNPSLARIYGYSSVEEFLSERTDVRTQIYVQPGRREEFVRLVHESGSITGFESEIYLKNGETSWVSESARVVCDREGNPTYYEGTVEEITARKQIEAEREKASRAALESARMKSEFVATVSHEIRTPLNAIIPSTEQLLTTRLDRQQRHLVESVDYGAHMLLQIVNDILEVSRIEAGAIRLESIDFNLHDVVERTVAFFATTAHAKRLELVGNIRPGVPLHVRGDPGRLAQVLNNLLGNAIKFTEHGEVEIEIECGNDEKPQASDDIEVHFRIRDTGIGIPAEARELVFQPFAQADGSMARRYGGTGLGLTISRRFVELMGGALGFDSEVGNGTTFHFHIRLQHPQSPPQRLVPAPAPAIAPAFHHALVVDDSPALRRLIVELLQEHAQAAANAVPGIPEALDLIRRRDSDVPFDVVLFDAELPGIDLVQAARRLRAGAASGCRLVALTAPGGAAADRGLEAAGLAGTIVKPIRQSHFAAELAAILTGQPASDPHPVVAEVSLPIPGAGLLVLVVEDNSLNQRVAVDLLRRLGASVEAASSGPAAIETIRQRRYDLVLMDCQMPGMDGYETTRRIRALESSEEWTAAPLQIVALSANALDGDRDRGLQAGMDDYLTKPLRQPELIRILENIATLGCAKAEPPPAGPASPDPAPVPLVEPVIDLSPLQALESPETPDVVSGFIEDFCSEAPGRIEKIALALLAGDAATVRLETHTLKGNASYMGARRLVAACLALETAARAGDLSGGSTSLAAIREEFKAAEIALHEFIGRGASSS